MALWASVGVAKNPAENGAMFAPFPRSSRIQFLGGRKDYLLGTQIRILAFKSGEGSPAVTSLFCCSTTQEQSDLDC